MSKCNDGKLDFYRKLELDKHDMKLVKYFRLLKQRMLNEPDVTASGTINKK